MKTFKNTAAENNSTVTNVFFAQGEKPEDFGNWVECEDLEMEFSNKADHLFTINGTRYFGKL